MAADGGGRRRLQMMVWEGGGASRRTVQRTRGSIGVYQHYCLRERVLSLRRPPKGLIMCLRGNM